MSKIPPPEFQTYSFIIKMEQAEEHARTSCHVNSNTDLVQPPLEDWLLVGCFPNASVYPSAW